jgi:hypothetical protein
MDPGRRPSREMLITSGEREPRCFAIVRWYDPYFGGPATYLGG